MNPRNINRHQSLARRVGERDGRRRREEMTERRNDRGPRTETVSPPS